MNEAQLTTLAKEIIKRKDANSHVMISEDKPKVEKKYKGVCPTCSREILRHRKKQISCGKCSKTYSPEHAFIWSINTNK